VSRAERALLAIMLPVFAGSIYLVATGPWWEVALGTAGAFLAPLIVDEALTLAQVRPPRPPELARVSLDGPWTCHVCSRRRPDEAIDTVQRGRRVGPGMLTVSVRFCADRDSCASGAEGVAERWLDAVGKR
jgi:hypothetical protein